jgi:hypothetical protein
MHPGDLSQSREDSRLLTSGRDTTDADIDYVPDVLPRFVARPRGLSSHQVQEATTGTAGVQ